MNQRSLLIGLFFFGSACSSSEIGLGARDPANPDSPSAPLPPAGEVFAPEFDPLAVSEGSAKSFSCPMHPQIVRAQPGKCPICGMELEPSDAEPPRSEGRETK